MWTPDGQILFSSVEVTSDPVGIAEALVDQIKARRDSDERYEAIRGRSRPRSNRDLYQMAVHSIFTEEYESYFNSDGSYRPRDADG